MTAQSTSSKISLLLLLLIVSMSSVLAFPHSMLGGAGQTPSEPFTVAGQARTCSEYADETGTFTGAKTITSKQTPALVNVYLVNSNGGWTYYNEFTAPVSINLGDRKVAYEVYYCPTQAATCTNGQVRAVTETSFQTCTSGKWGTEQKCAVGSYFSPQDGKCITTACKEQWSCTSFGDCTADGKQYRTCTDANRCGTFRDRPAVTNSCTPRLSNGAAQGTTGQGLKIISQPKLDKYEAEAGEARIVTQTFQVVTPGEYWIEAGIEQLRGFSIADVEVNTCNPNEPWYANQLVRFDAAGNVTKTFKVTPQADGEFVLHTAIVTGCAGDVVQKEVASDHLIVGHQDAGKATMTGTLAGNKGTLLIMGGVILAIVGAGMYAYRRK